MFPGRPAFAPVRWLLGASILAAPLLCGCVPAGQSEEGKPDAVWGGLGVTKARFRKPRAMAIDDEGKLVVA